MRRLVRLRWIRLSAVPDETLARAIAVGVLGVGDIPCAVLNDPDNTRVLSYSGFLSALGRTGNAKVAPSPEYDDTFSKLPVFLQAKNLEPFISNELARSSTPIPYATYLGSGYQGKACALSGV